MFSKKKVLLIYPPFCTPASPPYSLTNLHSFLQANSNHQIEILDLNLEFHKIKFFDYKQYYQQNKWGDYDQITKEYRKETAKVYSENNKKVRLGEQPELFDILLKKIKDQKPEVIAFSVVYSSQVFYTYALIKQLNKSIKCVVGGPAVNDKLKEVAEVMFNEVEFLEFLSGKVNHNDLNTNYYLDYSQLKDYFVPKLVIPLKTTSTCFYRGCTFCNHYKDVSYQEYSLKIIRETVVNSNEKFFFLVDDMISVKRLLQLAEIFGSLGVEWACQLRPTRDLTLEILKKLKGLKFVIWGVESGSDRILKLMNKGTIRKDVETVLRDAHQIGIKNVLYMMIGFPTETKIELKETIDFLENNQENIDLVSTSVFGLQKDTFVYCNPRRFGIKKIIEEKRTILEPKILYEVENPVDTIVLRKKYYQIVGQINKYPKGMNFFREHMFFV